MACRITGLIALVLSAALPISTASADEQEWNSLWNGKNLDGWSTWLGKPSPTSDVPGLPKDDKGQYTQTLGTAQDPLNVFTVNPNIDGQPAIRISGECFGELRSATSLTNYHLRLQFKWGDKKWPPRDEPETQRDSGLLYHVHSEPGFDGRTWSRSIEYQIQEHDCGDLYAVGSAIAVRSTYDKSLKYPSYVYDKLGTWTYFSQIPGQNGRCIKSPDAEKPNGEWNTVELICLGNDAIHILNGVVVMRLHSPMRIDGPTPEPITSGPIILQSEGAEIFYRDIRYRPISSIPKELLD
jgi:hypothetical protein